MSAATKVETAFEHALEKVDRAIAVGMKTPKGSSAVPELQRLRSELEQERERSRERGFPDPEWVRRVIRDVVDWTPENELGLLAALGRIARAGVRATQE